SCTHSVPAFVGERYMVRSIYLLCLRGAIIVATVVLALLISIEVGTSAEKILGFVLCIMVLLSSLRMLRQIRRGAEERVHQSQVLLSDAEQLARFGSWEWDIRSNS